jgi:hypothetical protein
MLFLAPSLRGYIFVHTRSYGPFVSLYVALPYPEVFCDNNVRELASYQSYMPHTDKMEKTSFFPVARIVSAFLSIFSISHLSKWLVAWRTTALSRSARTGHHQTPENNAYTTDYLYEYRKMHHTKGMFVSMDFSKFVL